MALRDQPYLPLYVRDFLTDEKLMECSASATGIYIRLLCIMHKSDEYGVILLKQKDKQTDNQIKNFAIKLAKYLPYSTDEIISGIAELITEGVLQNEGDKLSQKRMIKDNEISIVRAESGKKGGIKTQFAKAKEEANPQANTEDEDKDVIVVKEIECQFENFRKLYPARKRGFETEYKTLQKHKDYKDIIPLLMPALNSQIEERRKLKELNRFVPEWKNLQTWINQRCWEEEIQGAETEKTVTGLRSSALPKELQGWKQ